LRDAPRLEPSLKTERGRMKGCVRGQPCQERRRDLPSNIPLVAGFKNKPPSPKGISSTPRLPHGWSTKSSTIPTLALFSTASTRYLVMRVFTTPRTFISVLVTVFETVPTFLKISNVVCRFRDDTRDFVACSLAWGGSWRLFLRWATRESHSLICLPSTFADPANWPGVREAFPSYLVI